MKGWLFGKRGDMIEAALTFPIMALLALALVNLALAGVAKANASNAAHASTRMASVAVTNPVQRGLAAAQQVLESTGVGKYEVTVTADPNPGGPVVTRVHWEIPNLYGSLLRVFGVAGSGRAVIEGEEVSVARKEGWVAAR